MIRRRVAEVPDPHEHPHTGCGAEDDERATPGDGDDQPRDDRRRGALPNRANACVRPCAKPRRPAGVQSCIARVATGNVAPSPTPSSTRTAKSVANPPTSPVRIVAVAQISPQMNSVRRGPTRSPSPASEDLKEQIRDSRTLTARARAVCSRARALLNRGRRGRDVDAIDIRDQIHHAQQAEDDGCGRDALGGRHAGGYRLSE